ncbi:MAG: hypothetical protein HZA78_13200 [Candidatus Schekmanbacteria bacterium]|nr:hypothetical protein [Candidatus Schekmanbacteria bacterium]
MYYEEIFRELSHRRIKYLVAGGVALVLHGVLRLTADLDLLLDMETANLIKFVEVMQALDYKPKLPVAINDFLDSQTRQKWVLEKNLSAFSFVNTNGYQIVNVLLNTPLDFSPSAKHKKTFTAKGINIPIVSAADLIQMKRFAGRPQDLADIAALEQIINRL